VVSDNDKLVANPMVVFREELDGWAILFDPDTGESYGLNPVSAFIWKCLDGQHTIQDILSGLRENCDSVPEDAEDLVNKFIQDLVERGFAGYEM